MKKVRNQTNFLNSPSGCLGLTTKHCLILSLAIIIAFFFIQQVVFHQHFHSIKNTHLELRKQQKERRTREEIAWQKKHQLQSKVQSVKDKILQEQEKVEEEAARLYEMNVHKQQSKNNNNDNDKNNNNNNNPSFSNIRDEVERKKQKLLFEKKQRLSLKIGETLENDEAKKTTTTPSPRGLPEDEVALMELRMKRKLLRQAKISYDELPIHRFEKPFRHRRYRRPILKIPKFSELNCSLKRMKHVPAFTRHRRDQRPKYAVISLVASKNGTADNVTRRETMHALTFINKLNYCHRHGYDLIIEGDDAVDPRRKPHWSKIRVLRKWLPFYDWVVWMDEDTMFVNFDYRIEDMVHTKLEFFLIRDMQAQEKHSHFDERNFVYKKPIIDIILTKDWNNINSGVMFLRSCAWTLDFLRRAYQVREELALPYADQGAFIWLTSPYRGRDRKEAIADRSHLWVSEDNFFNSYPANLIHQERHMAWQFEENDWIIHFSSCKYFWYCMDWLKHYYNRSLCENEGSLDAPFANFKAPKNYLPPERNLINLATLPPLSEYEKFSEAKRRAREHFNNLVQRRVEQLKQADNLNKVSHGYEDTNQNVKVRNVGEMLRQKQKREEHVKQQQEEKQQEQVKMQQEQVEQQVKQQEQQEQAKRERDEGNPYFQSEEEKNEKIQKILDEQMEKRHHSKIKKKLKKAQMLQAELQKQIEQDHQKELQEKQQKLQEQKKEQHHHHHGDSSNNANNNNENDPQAGLQQAVLNAEKMMAKITEADEYQHQQEEKERHQTEKDYEEKQQQQQQQQEREQEHENNSKKKKMKQKNFDIHVGFEKFHKFHDEKKNSSSSSSVETPTTTEEENSALDSFLREAKKLAMKKNFVNDNDNNNNKYHNRKFKYEEAPTKRLKNQQHNSIKDLSWLTTRRPKKTMKQHQHDQEEEDLPITTITNLEMKKKKKRKHHVNENNNNNNGEEFSTTTEEAAVVVVEPVQVGNRGHQYHQAGEHHQNLGAVDGEDDGHDREGQDAAANEASSEEKD